MRIVGIDAAILRAPRPRPYWGTSGVVVQKRPGYERTDPFADLSAVYPPRWRNEASYPRDLTTLLVRLTTEDGITGIGESKAPVGPRGVRMLFDELYRDLLLGQSSEDVHPIMERILGLMRIRGHVQGFHQEIASGIDIALWDIKGKRARQPVANLLGGQFCRQIRVYASGLPGLSSGAPSTEVEALQQQASEVLEKGYRAVKVALGAGIEADVRSVAAVRDVIGPDVTLLTDAVGSYDVDTSLRLANRLTAYNVAWLEAPLPFDDLEGYVDVSKRSPIPIACDVVWVPSLVRQLLQRGARIIFQPEVLKAGGISVCKHIADLADTFGLPFAPHVSQGSVIQFAASLQVAAASPNFLICEFPWREEAMGNVLLKNPLQFDQSCLAVPQEPGLGIELDPEALDKVLVPEAETVRDPR
ncbi:MAG: hypothetical protein GEU99_10140 [Luteitalea sp.]|nr:hypothetical protein [Luteitalea sp.]